MSDLTDTLRPVEAPGVDAAAELYRRLMRLYAQRRRPDAVARAWRVLQDWLAELNVEPEDATTKLIRDLSSPASARTSAGGSSRASASVRRP